MTKRDPVAGGFFLIVPLIAGFSWGLANDVALNGALIGLAVGILLALAVWLFDRARRPR
ncbi:MAG: hypothetical protein LH465_07690 [Sphingomonas bacterium]|nr:hypothetical protein [Sphingomonas bacterium]